MYGDFQSLKKGSEMSIYKDFIANARSTDQLISDLSQCVSIINSSTKDDLDFAIEIDRWNGISYAFGELLLSFGFGYDDIYKLYKNIINNLLKQDGLGFIIGNLKEYYKVPRPIVFSMEQFNINISPFHTEAKNEYSYPSGHSAIASMIALVIILHLNDQLTDAQKLKIKQLSDKIAVSRVQIGAHYPHDVNQGRVLAKKFITEICLNSDFICNLPNKEVQDIVSLFNDDILKIY